MTKPPLDRDTLVIHLRAGAPLLGEKIMQVDFSGHCFDSHIDFSDAEFTDDSFSIFHAILCGNQEFSLTRNSFGSSLGQYFEGALRHEFKNKKEKTGNCFEKWETVSGHS